MAAADERADGADVQGRGTVRVLRTDVIIVAKTCLSAIVVIAPLVLAAWVPIPGPAIVTPAVLALWGVSMTLLFERLLFADTLRTAARAIGFTRGRSSTQVIALLASLPMWAGLPVLARLNDIPIALRPDWPWVLLGVILLNGMTEEIIHRGFVFNHFRREHTFLTAASIAAAVFAAQHLYLILTTGWIAGVSSVILAALLTFPLAYVFERGGRAVGPPAILHTSSNAPMLMLVSPSGPLTAVLVPYMGVVLASIYLVFLFGRFDAHPDAPRD
jgi:membrane protease YdiL (CAAX protease family)